MNETPRILRNLLALAKEIMAGATQLQAVIGMHHHTDTTLEAAISLVNTCEGAEAQCKNLRDADKDALFKELSGCIVELHRLLPADDSRWETFGLNIPANPNPPEEVKWDRARRATYYRIFIKVAGVDEDFRYYDRDEDLEYMIRDLTPGSMISVYIVAANAGGEATPSPTVTKVVGA